MTRSACPHTGKVCHTKPAAKKHAASLMRSEEESGMPEWPVDVYRCDHWQDHPPGRGKFHVGHRGGKQ